MQLTPTQAMVDEAVYFLREHEPPEGYFLGFSGGKDSICLIELAKISGVKYTPYYSATGIDPPEVVKFIRINYPEVIWLRPKYSFWEGVYKKFPPLRMYRWCCDVLKKDPAKHIGLSNRIMGIRSEESLGRANRPRIDHYKSYKQQQIFKPIFHWKEWHVWDLIESNNLEYPSLYNEGFDRIGCVICPFLPQKNMKKINKHIDRWPKYYKVFEHSVDRWFNKNLLKREEKTSSEYIQKWYRGFE